MNGLIILTARCIWLERNKRVFDHIASSAQRVCFIIMREFEEWRRAGLGGKERGFQFQYH